MLWCNVCLPIFEKSQTLKTAEKPGKLDKRGHNIVIFSQATGQTWNHTGAYHLSALVKFSREMGDTLFLL